MRIAGLCAAILLITASQGWAQTGSRFTPVPSRTSTPEIIDCPVANEAPQQRVQRLEAELNQARHAAGAPFPTSSPAPRMAALPEVPPPPSVGAPVVSDDSWRYKQMNGTWWYLQPNNRWVYWSYDHWVEYVAPVPHVHVVPHYYPRHYDYHGPSIGLFFGHGHSHHRHGHHHHH